MSKHYRQTQQADWYIGKPVPPQGLADDDQKQYQLPDEIRAVLEKMKEHWRKATEEHKRECQDWRGYSRRPNKGNRGTQDRNQ